MTGASLTAPPSAAGRLARRAATVAIAVLLAIAALGALRTISPSPAGKPPAASTPQRYQPAPQSAAMEARWGVRFSQVAVTADGGLVDLRYVVLDEARAAGVGASGATSPKVYDERSQTLLDTPTMAPHGHHLRRGSTAFLLLRNTGGAVRRGDRVTIVVGRTRLSGVPVL